MRRFGLTLTALAILCLAEHGFVSGKEAAKSNATKIVGTWEVTKSQDAPPGSTVEFAKGGKMKVTITLEGKTLTLEGTYKVEGDKIKSTLKQGETEHSETIKIKTLTDTRLVTEDEKGKIDEFKKKQ